MVLARNNILLRCIGRYWPFATHSAVQQYVCTWVNSGRRLCWLEMT